MRRPAGSKGGTVTTLRQARRKQSVTERAYFDRSITLR